MGNLLCLDLITPARSLRDFYWGSSSEPGNSSEVNDCCLDPAEGQRQCLDTLRELFPERRFRRCCPPFLLHPEASGYMDLDLYCAELGLAVEYNAKHHFMYDPQVHQSIDDFRTGQRRDDLKKQLCERHGVQLIVVPYYIQDIREYLICRIRDIPTFADILESRTDSNDCQEA